MEGQSQVQTKRHTIYDQIANSGHFDLNPANASARDYKTGEKLYKGPVEFPKMLYHPKGELECIVPANYVVDPVRGPVKTDEQFALIARQVETPEEEAALLKEGWHKTPAHAEAARTGKEVPKTEAEKAADLDAENAILRAKVAELQAAAEGGKPPAPPEKPTGQVNKK